MAWRGVARPRVQVKAVACMRCGQYSPCRVEESNNTTGREKARRHYELCGWVRAKCANSGADRCGAAAIAWQQPRPTPALPRPGPRSLPGADATQDISLSATPNPGSILDDRDDLTVTDLATLIGFNLEFEEREIERNEKTVTD
ncbi:hypothetical protein J6590_054700 [Homalodisca vitripennis]|nr:hypothetical protein J6590_054700 [Homalodisca vitripennis]